MFRLFAWIVCLLVATGSAALADTQRELITIRSDDSAQATLTAVAADGRLTFAAAEPNDKPATWQLPTAEIVSWGQPVEPTGNLPRWHLAGGGQLVGALRGSDGDRVTIDNPLIGEISLPVELLAAAVLRPTADRQHGDQLVARLTGQLSAEDNTASGDRLVLENGDELTGTVGAIDAKTVAIDTTSGPLEIPLSRVLAIGFDPELIARPRPTRQLLHVGLRDGSRFVAAHLVANEGIAEITLAGLHGSAGPAPASAVWRVPLETIVYLQPLGESIVYLSDLAPSDYRHVPFLSLPWDYALDRNVAGTHLRSGGRLFVKGIGMHSTSRLTYNLDAAYRRFEAQVAIDDHTEGRGSVTFRVFVDGSQRYASPIMRGGMPPQGVSIDVSGARQLSLIVDFADHGDEFDRANWLDARLVKGE